MVSEEIRAYERLLAARLESVEITSRNTSDELSHFLRGFPMQLREAIHFKYPEIMSFHVGWSRNLLTARGMSGEQFDALLGQVVDHALSAASASLAEDVKSVLNISTLFTEDTNYTSTTSYIDRTDNMGSLAGQYLDLLLERKKSEALDFVQGLYKNGVEILDIYMNIFQVVLTETGRLWELNKLSVLQEHYITAITQMAMSQLFPHIIQTPKKGISMISCCIGEEVHEIGIRMVSDLFELDGWDSYYVGANTPMPGIINGVSRFNPNIIAISVTGTQFFSQVEKAIESLKNDERSEKVRILVGGHAFNRVPALVERVRADGYAPNAMQAISVAERLVA